MCPSISTQPLDRLPPVSSARAPEQHPAAEPCAASDTEDVPIPRSAGWRETCLDSTVHGDAASKPVLAEQLEIAPELDRAGKEAADSMLALGRSLDFDLGLGLGHSWWWPGALLALMAALIVCGFNSLEPLTTSAEPPAIGIEAALEELEGLEGLEEIEELEQAGERAE